MSKNKYSYQLNKTTHFIRPSQLVYQNGVGAMVDFPSQTLITASHKHWRQKLISIRDHRLEEKLNVSEFRLPGKAVENDEVDGRISFFRFPEWYFCSRCRDFKPIKVWVNDYQKKSQEHNKHMHKKLLCLKCNSELVVSRLVGVCEHGHIDDFPWIQWAHSALEGENGTVCSQPELSLSSSIYSTEGLDNVVVKCKTCTRERNLKGSLNDYINKICEGKHPWKESKEKCDQKIKALLRGASSVYYPVTISSLIIPSQTSETENLIKNSDGFRNVQFYLENISSDTISEDFHKFVKKQIIDIVNQTGVIENHINDFIIDAFSSTKKTDIDDKAYLYQEYKALKGEIIPDIKTKKDFVCEHMDVARYKLPFIKQIGLVHKLREVRVQLGFSRLYPIENLNNLKDNKRFVSIQNESNWLPGMEVKGEGIFIEFDGLLLNEWIQNNHLVEARINLIRNKQGFSEIDGPNEKINPKFMFLHTLSHLLIKQLAIDSGYSISSIRERIYCSSDINGKEMQGILIYTASGDSEGTLGGLVRQGRHDYLPKIIDKAIHSADLCSNDPVCMLSQGQGRDSLNLAGCHACVLLPETSCVEFNCYLDRALLVGTYQDEDIGFFNHLKNIKLR